MQKKLQPPAAPHLTRYLLLVVLLLTSAPGVAWGGEAVHRSEQDRISAHQDGGSSEIARSTGGVEIVQRLGAHGAGCSCGAHTGGRPTDAAASEVPALSSAHLPLAETASDEGIFSPHAERLPYHATAPPSLR